MNNSEFSQRHVIVDVQPSIDARVRRRRGKGNGRPQPQAVKKSAFPDFPLEMRPVIAAALEYGKRTYSLGVLRGANALLILAEHLRSREALDETRLTKIINDAEYEAAELKKLLELAYEED